MGIWANPFTCVRAPRMFNLRMDPYEHAQISGDNYDYWRVDKAYIIFEGTRRASKFLQTFVEYPPSQIPASFSIDQVESDTMKRVQQMGGGRGEKLNHRSSRTRRNFVM